MHFETKIAIRLNRYRLQSQMRYSLGNRCKFQASLRLDSFWRQIFFCWRIADRFYPVETLNFEVSFTTFGFGVIQHTVYTFLNKILFSPQKRLAHFSKTNPDLNERDGITLYD